MANVAFAKHLLTSIAKFHELGNSGATLAGKRDFPSHQGTRTATELFGGRLLIEGGFTIMLTVTKKAAAFLKVAKAAEGATRGAGIRLRRDAMPDESGKPSVGFTF